MEAGSVPAAAGDNGQVEAPAGPDLGPLMDRMDQLASSVEEIGARFPAEQEQEPEGYQQQGWPPQQQFGQQPAPYGGMYGQPQPQQFQGGFQQQPEFGQAPVPGMPAVVDPYTGEINQNALAAYLGSVPQMAAAGVLPQVQEMLKPVLEQFQTQQAQLQEERMDRGFQGLESEFPALQDTNTATKVIGRAAEVAASLGQDPKEACGNPGFVRMVYLADMATQQNGGNGQQAEGRPPELEQGGGATPGGSNGNDWVSHVQGRRQDSAVQDFWGVPAT